MTVTISDHYIGGRWVASIGTGVIDVENPGTGEVLGTIPAGVAADVGVAVAAARAAFATWSQTSMSYRIDRVKAIRDALADHRDAIAAVLTAEMGSPITFSKQAQLGVALADMDALLAAAGTHDDRTAISNSLVVTEAAGVVAAVTPWNFPLHQIVLKLAAALLAGCTVVLKPSEVAPFNAVRLTELIDAVGLPAGVLNVVFGDGQSVGEPLVGHPDVDVVTFTGSRRVGERVAAIGAATIKRVALELGGKSAAIVLDDAPPEQAVADVLRSCFANTGQTCAALTRVLIPESLAARWEELVLEQVGAWAPGDPMDESTRMGPLASHLQRDRVLAHIRQAQEQGARLITGGLDAPPALSAGAYVMPTVFADVSADMDLFRDEVFGPVLAITTYQSLEEAVALANDSDYGLSGGVWSADREHAIAVARRLRTGTVGINGAGLDVGAPFGGYKQSGIGRECGQRGLEEFLEIKSIMGGVLPA